VQSVRAVKDGFTPFEMRDRRQPARQSVAGIGQVPPSSRRAENIFPRHILKREGSLDAAWGSAAVVSSMIELIAMAVGLASAFIFLMHAIEAYRA
jgi:hypothetical protein